VATTRGVRAILPHSGPLPVDVRHNTKLNREVLAVWASQRIATIDA
jgi:hypothetical protein